MNNLNKEDNKLIEYARDIIEKNYDGVNYKHTVGAAVRCKNGKIYTGVNVYSNHGACAEMIAFGTAITNGEREFDTVVSVLGGVDTNVLSPCGNCRQFISEYAKECNVIVQTEYGLVKTSIKELLPFRYTRK
jgi:cytidine deaminase